MMGHPEPFIFRGVKSLDDFTCTCLVGISVTIKKCALSDAKMLLCCVVRKDGNKTLCLVERSIQTMVAWRAGIMLFWATRAQMHSWVKQPSRNLQWWVVHKSVLPNAKKPIFKKSNILRPFLEVFSRA